MILLFIFIGHPALQLPTSSCIQPSQTSNMNSSTSEEKSGSGSESASVSCSQCSHKYTCSNLGFSYSNCFTPVVTEVENKKPQNRRLIFSDIVIRGNLFSSVLNENVVHFGTHQCVVKKANDTVLVCAMDISTEPPMNTWLPLSLHVKEKGDALIKISNQFEKSVIFQNSLTFVGPLSGSYGGCRTVNITGAGFHDSINVTIGSLFCIKTALSYVNIQCAVPAMPYNSTLVTKVPIRVFDTLYQTSHDGWNSKPNHQYMFEYNPAETPEILEISPTTVHKPNVVININVTKVGTASSSLKIEIGKVNCEVQSLKDFSNLTNILCSLKELEAGEHTLVLTRRQYGCGVSNETFFITSSALVSSAQPSSGSIYGGTEVTIHGHGFHLHGTDVMFGDKPADILSIRHSQIVVKTPASKEGEVTVKVLTDGVSFEEVKFEYATAKTPEITSLSPTNGVGGNVLTLDGQFYTNDAVDVQIKVGNTVCQSLAVSSNQITCTLKEHLAGLQNVQVYVNGYGVSSSEQTFTYNLQVSSIQPVESGFGGGLILDVTGRGFGHDTVVTICGSDCAIQGKPTNTTLKCLSPVFNGEYSVNLPDQNCDVNVTQSDQSIIYNTKYTYKQSLTSSITDVSPRRGGTGGGVRLTITGTNFLTDKSLSTVAIAGVECPIQSMTATEIVCITGSTSNTTLNTNVIVNFENQGFAVPINATFSYVDVWSSKFSWGGMSPPQKGI